MAHNFCSQCGGKTHDIIPDNDNRMRCVCSICNFVQYKNPLIVSGCLIAQSDKILLAKRAIEPRLGYWTLPAGFLEMQESVQQGAERECQEELGAAVKSLQLQAIYTLTRQIHFIFYGKLLTQPQQSTLESLEIAFFDLDAIPWNEIAFPVNIAALKLYLDNPQAENEFIDLR